MTHWEAIREGETKVTAFEFDDLGECYDIIKVTTLCEIQGKQLKVCGGYPNGECVVCCHVVCQALPF